MMFVTTDPQNYHTKPHTYKFLVTGGRKSAPISFPDNITESTLEQVIRGADNDLIDGVHQKIA
jgi:hypothetical protein